MLVETAVRMKFFQTTATHEPQKLMSVHIMEEHIINITSSKIERERERERERKKDLEGRHVMVIGRINHS